MPADYELDELMCALMAREIKDGDWVNHGASVPLAGAALMLAKHTHAPNLEFFYLGTVFNAVGPAVTDLARLMLEPELAYSSSRALMSHADICSLTLRGRADFQYLRPIQVDPFGNVNTSVVGNPEAPKYRFHGIAVADAMVLVGRVCLYVTEHDHRVFCDPLSFRTGTGHVESDAWRERIDAPGRGPAAVVTPLCVIDFEGPDCRAQLRSVHPGVTVDEVQAATGFELHVPEDVPESIPPTDVELEVLRELVDPLATRHMEFKALRPAANRRLAEHRDSRPADAAGQKPRS
jgi:glutaconate CoA-transferase subunit B